MRYALSRDGLLYVEVPTLTALVSAAARLGRDYAKAGRPMPEMEVKVEANRRWRVIDDFIECPCCGEIYLTGGANAGKAWDNCPSCDERLEGKRCG